MKRQSRFGWFGIAWLGLACAAAQGAVFYVSPGGSDAADGSPATPWRTIQYAITNAAVANGDEIRVGEGLYVESVTNNAYTAGKGGKHRLTLKGGFETNAWTWDPANHPSVIRPPTNTLDCLYLYDARTNTVIGFTLTGGRYGIYSYLCFSVPNVLTNSHHTFSHLIVSNNASHGINVYAGQHGAALRNCLIVRNGGSGYYQVVDNGADSYFSQCTIADNTGNGLYSDHNYNKSFWFRGCVVANNGGYAFRKDTGAGMVRVYDSCVWSNAMGNFKLVDAASVHGGTLIADPRFAGPGDYRLQNGSPCVDRAASLTADPILPVTDDLEGTARSGAYDMGCYQSAYSAASLLADTYADASRPDNSGDGSTPATAKKSIGEALAFTAVSGVCHVASGLYREEVALATLGATLIGTNAPDTIVSNAMAAAAWVSVSNAVIRGLTLTGAQAGLRLMKGPVASNIVVYGCIVRGNTNGVKVIDAPDTATKLFFSIFNSVIISNVQDGVYMAAGLNGLTMRNCLVAFNGQDGIDINEDNGAAQTLHNCTISSNGAIGVNASHTYTTTFTLRNCAVTGNRQYGTLTKTYAVNLAYSLFHGNTTNFSGSVTLGTGIYYTDPLFVGPGDFHVQSSSPAVDNGLDLSAQGVTNDLDGAARSAPFDIGCYQSPYTKPVPQAHAYADAVNGNNDWAGTNWATAKATLAAALTITDSNGVCHVAPGTYNEEVSLDLVGVTLQGEDRDACIVNGKGGNVVFLQATNTTVRRLTLTGGQYGVRATDDSVATNLLVDQCVLRNNTYGFGDQTVGYSGRGRYTLSRCIVSNNTSHGICILNGKTGVMIENCLIVKNGGHGLYTAQDNSSAWYAYACTIADNGKSGVKYDHGYGYSTVVTFKNCIVSHNGAFAIERFVASDNYVDPVENSCFHGNALGNFSGAASLTDVFDADPRFLAADDYRLSSGSPCVGAGADLSADAVRPVTNDLAGTVRAAPRDLGCFESAEAPSAKLAVVYADASRPDDTGDGASPATAKKAIGEALALVASNGVCIVAPGSYAEQLYVGPAGVTLSGSGPESCLVTSPASRATWQTPGPHFIPCNSNWQAMAWFQATNVTVAGFTFDGGERGVLFAAKDPPQGMVSNCVIRNAEIGVANQPIYTSSRIVLRQCVITNHGEGVVLYYRLGLTAENCLIANCRGAGIHTSVETYGAVVNQLRYCTLANNATGYWASLSTDNAVYYTNCVIASNRVYGIAQTGLGVRSNLLAYSCVTGNGTNFYSDNNKIGIDGTVITSAVPVFRKNSYELDFDSPCVNGAVNIGIYLDAAGRTRPRLGGFDMGAYEMMPPRGTVIVVR